MASRKYLNISFDYVPNWDYICAIREIFQNSLDAEVEDPANKMYFEYDEDAQILNIGNLNGKLEENSLLLGQSSKREDDNQIGQHGEGYKVATVVLLREGLGLKIYNYNKKQVWVAKSVKSRTYKENIPVFDIEHQVFKKGADLMFEISGITKEMFENIVNSNLHLIEKYRGTLGVVKESDDGRILLDEQFKHKVFVKGLYVCDSDKISYGYDFSPSWVKLDRDRHLIDTFNIIWNASRLIAHSHDNDFIKDSLDKSDSQYVSNFVYSLDSELRNSVTDDFIKKNGTMAVPCVTQDDFNEAVSQGYKGVLVSNTVSEVIKTSPIYASSVVKVKPLNEQLKIWFDEVSAILNETGNEKLLEEGTSLVNRIISII